MSLQSLSRRISNKTKVIQIEDPRLVGGHVSNDAVARALGEPHVLDVLLPLIQKILPAYTFEVAKSQGGCSLSILALPRVGTSARSADDSEEGIIQLRPCAFAVRTDVIKEARQVYGQKAVPEMKSLGCIVCKSPTGKTFLNVQLLWSRRVMPGTTAEELLAIPASAQTYATLLSGLADVFARSWTRRQKSSLGSCWKGPKDRCTGKVGSSIGTRLTWLENRLPSADLRTIARDTRREYDAGRMSSLPVVLSHGDLRPSNILVDLDTGHITGIIDWAEAERLPFGIALYAVDLLLGRIDSTLGFVWHMEADRLRNHFWTCLLHRIPELRDESVRFQILLARTIGILLWFGIAWDDGKINRVVDEVRDAETLNYLRAFLSLKHDI